MITKSELKERDWTEGMIKKFLGDADLEKSNPHYKSASPMKLYFLDRVTSIEGTEEFSRAKEKACIRKVVAVKAVKSRQEKTEKLTKELIDASVPIPIMDQETLKKKACLHYNKLWLSRGKNHKEFNPNDEVPQRIIVNYLRHELSDYEANLDKLYGKVGTDEAKRKIKVKVLDAIAKTYSVLAEECARQSCYRFRI